MFSVWLHVEWWLALPVLALFALTLAGFVTVAALLRRAWRDRARSSRHPQ